MITTVSNHISLGVVNNADSSQRATFYRANFNMPTKNFYLPAGTWGKFTGNYTLDTEVTNGSLDLWHISPGMEICLGTALFTFDNDSGSDYSINTTMSIQWLDPSYNEISRFDYPVSGTIPAGYWAGWGIGFSLGCAPWEVTSNDTYYLRSFATGTPNIGNTDVTITFSNVQSTTQLSSGTDGHIWVEGNDLCLVNANLWKHTIVGLQGADVGTSSVGHIWIDTANDLHWIGADGYDYTPKWKVKQFASFYSESSTSEVNAGTSKAGYFWMDNEFGFTHLAYIGYDGYKYLTGAGYNPYTAFSGA